MKCPKCSADNPDKAKFCNQCGDELTIICSKCNSTSPPESRFCNECGHDLHLPPEQPVKVLSFESNKPTKRVAKSSGEL